MDNITLLGWMLLFLSSIISVLNVGILLHLLSRGRMNIADKNLNLNSKEIDLLHRQYIYLEAKSDANLKRIDVIEKVLSAIVISNQFDDGSSGVLH